MGIAALHYNDGRKLSLVGRVKPRSSRCVMADDEVSKSRSSSIGESIGRAMAERIVNLNRTDAIIIDNHPEVIFERRKVAPESDYIGPPRRSTDEKPTE